MVSVSVPFSLFIRPIWESLFWESFLIVPVAAISVWLGMFAVAFSAPPALRSWSMSFLLKRGEELSAPVSDLSVFAVLSEVVFIQQVLRNGRRFAANAGSF